MPSRAHYSDSIDKFLDKSENEIVGALTERFYFAVEPTQNSAWRRQVGIMKRALAPYGARGEVYFEYEIPRLGGRIDVAALIDGVIFVLEFKVGARAFERGALDQVCDYALDLKNFHETSHARTIAPIVVATEARSGAVLVATTPQQDKLLVPMKANGETLGEVIAAVLTFADDDAINAAGWEQGRYSPTPTIIEAARALYGGHKVDDISRSDAGATNLRDTADTVARIIQTAKKESGKHICFVTGVPGAGKTLVGLNVATQRNDDANDTPSIFLSGNAPLVSVLSEALARDEVRREKEKGETLRIGEARSAVKAFIQNVHHFRDEYIAKSESPVEHTAIFDEAQRAWNLQQTNNFMRRKKGIENFGRSEPQFLISCLDRHQDWAVVVCLVGGGQEIKIGEAGIGGWIDALADEFTDWHAHISSQLQDKEYEAGNALTRLQNRGNLTISPELHLATSMRSFRAERVSLLVKQILDLEVDNARQTLDEIKRYPIVLTRSVNAAKAWLRERARGSERYGMIVSSQAERLRPHAIDVRPRVNPVHWFLNGKDDVRSSYYLEDVVTEFEVQGLEVDWACVTWDADFRRDRDRAEWAHWSFKGKRWNKIHKLENRAYQKNAYRVLLTRARQGMVIVVPPGDRADPTRACSFYDPTYEYLKAVGFATI